MERGDMRRWGTVVVRGGLFVKPPLTTTLQSHTHTHKHTHTHSHTHTHTPPPPPTYSNLTKMIFIEFVESLVYLSEITTSELDDDEPLLARMQHLLEKLKVLAITRRSAAAAETE